MTNIYDRIGNPLAGETKQTAKAKGLEIIEARFRELPGYKQLFAQLLCNTGEEQTVYKRALKTAGDKAELVVEHNITPDDLCNMVNRVVGTQAAVTAAKLER